MHYGKKTLDRIQEELDFIKKDKNVHVLNPFAMRVNAKRSISISRFKRAICLDWYKDIFPSNNLYTYYINAPFFFTTDIQLTLQSLAALNMMN